jgi:hypothetical protein
VVREILFILAVAAAGTIPVLVIAFLLFSFFSWFHYTGPGADQINALGGDTGITILNHLDVKASLWDVFRRDPTPQKGIFTAMPAFALAEPMMFWILSGTLERFPKLRVILVEPGLGWLPFFFETVLDPRMTQHYEFPGVKMLPSEYFKRQMGATFMYEPQGLGAAYRYFGPDCLYWSTDFPHPATCWPNSRNGSTCACSCGQAHHCRSSALLAAMSARCATGWSTDHAYR